MEAHRWFDDPASPGPADALRPVTFRDGEVLMTQGERGDSFVVIVRGVVRVDRTTDGASECVALVSDGSVLGELALLTGSPRADTVTAVGPVEALVGDSDTFTALLALPATRDHLIRTASERLAMMVEPVPVALADGHRVLLRPLRPDDRQRYVDAVGRASDDTLIARFFSGGQPSSHTVSYLLAVDYHTHLAWVGIDADRPEHPGVAVAHWFRNPRQPEEAEIALGILDSFQGRGLGRILLGALGVAALPVGITRLTAQVLATNGAMRSLLDRAGARWTPGGGPEAHAVIDARAAADLLPGELATSLASSIAVLSRTVTTALGRPADGAALRDAAPPSRPPARRRSGPDAP